MISKWRQFWCDLGFHVWKRMVREIQGAGGFVVYEITLVCQHCGRRKRWYE